MAYGLYRYGEFAAGLFGLFQGFLIDMYSVGPGGAFPAAYVGACGGITLGARLFDLGTPKGQCILVFMGTVVKEGLLMVLLHLLTDSIRLPSQIVGTYAVSAAITGAIAPFVFAILDRLFAGKKRGAAPEKGA